MTARRKQLLNIAGKFIGTYLVTDGKRVVIIKGYAVSGRVKKDISILIRKSKNMALGYFWKTYKKTGSAIFLKDWIVDYSFAENFLIIKREKVRGKYYNVVRNKFNGRYVSRSKWTWKKRLD